MSRAAIALMACLCWRMAAPGPADAQGTIAIVPAAVSAQDDFAQLKVKPGDIVYVTDARTAVEVSGAIARLSASSLAIGGYEFLPGAGLKIERRGDPIWNGALIGFGLGALVLFPVIPEVVPPRGRSVRPANGLLWAAIGALIDGARVGRTTIYDRSSDAPRRSVRLAPDVGTHWKGATLVVRF